MIKHFQDRSLERELLRMYQEELEEYKPPIADYSYDEFLEEVWIKQQEYRDELINSGVFQQFKKDEEAY